MENLVQLIILCSMPSLFFMLVAKVNGDRVAKWFSYIFIKLPTFVAVVLITIYLLKQHNII
jgi:ABC-type dipeptide/oligopeptide/nickel transport system permease component